MARIRSLKPEFWTSEQVMDVSRDARILFIGMWNFCDDAGIHSANERRLKAEVFPADDLTMTDVRRMIDELLRVGLLDEYEVAGQRFWIVTGWHHQKIDQPTFKHPGPDGTVPSGSPRRRQVRATTLHSASDRGPDVERLDNVRQVFGEPSENARRVDAERSSPEGRGEERSGIPKGSGASVVVGDEGDSRDDDLKSDGCVPVSAAQWATYFGDEHGIGIDPASAHERKRFVPLATAWCNARVSVGRMRAAIAEAQEKATEAIVFLPAYVDRVLANQGMPRASPRSVDNAAILSGLAGQSLGYDDEYNACILDVDAHFVA
ncbi:hypothetical protein [Pandoraea sputorum]|uniref:hypothetical protein n=1 Tax=Pandoraea sputorum TaxID=93222 RepID=UPI001240C6E4|nr:hypothetical protein [Pandoraea sputorum]